jgi:hypothetical protein
VNNTQLSYIKAGIQGWLPAFFMSFHPTTATFFLLNAFLSLNLQMKKE